MINRNVFSDPRYYQIVCLSLFLFFGAIFHNLNLNWFSIITVLIVCLFTQTLLLFINTKANESFNFSSLKSSLITALSLSLLLRANSPLIFVIAGVSAITAKFCLKTQEKHFFNPANFGIIMVLFFTNNAWISTGQWGNNYLFLLFFICSGLLVLNRVGRWETSWIFLLSYSLFEGIYYQFYLGWTFDVLQHHLANGNLLIFAFFMLSDPRSIPNATIGRIIWAMLIAIMTFLFSHILYINNSFLWSLFLVSPTTVLFDKFWQSPRFTWEN